MSFRFSCLFFCLINVVAFGQSPLPVGMRHFMQYNLPPAGAISYGSNHKVGYYVKADDARIYYGIYDKGRLMVVRHGGEIGSTYEMGQFIDSLSKRYQVITISTRGHGKSEIGFSSVTYRQKANDIYAVIQTV